MPSRIWQGVSDFTNVKMYFITMKPRSQRISWMLVFAIRRSLIPFMKTTGMLYPTFLTTILQRFVIRSFFIKVKTIANNEGIMPYIFDELSVSDYPLDLILNHVYDRSSGLSYHLSRKYLKTRN